MEAFRLRASLGDMDILDKIRTADPKTRVSFLHPDRAAESICDIQELREAIEREAHLQAVKTTLRLNTPQVMTEEEVREIGLATVSGRYYKLSDV